MRGTGYAVVEIILWMVAAAALGALIGWILRGWRRDVEIPDEWTEFAQAAGARQQALEDELGSARVRIAELEAVPDPVVSDPDEALREQLADAERQIAETEARLTSAVSERDALLAAAENVTDEAEPIDELDAADELGEETPAEEAPDREAAIAMVETIATRTRGAGPAVDDDLKLIHGVGPKLEGLLKSMGITSFYQVSQFTADDIAHVTAALEAFPGRIERDDWMGSAAEQHRLKYDEDLSGDPWA